MYKPDLVRSGNKYLKILFYSVRMKKLLSLLLTIGVMGFTPAGVIASDCTCECIKTTETIAKTHSKAPNTTINTTENYYIIAKGNVIKVAFECKFMSECAKEGDCIYFYVPKDIYTSCGTIVIPMGSKFTGYIRGISPQKKLNKNARVYININKLILPDNTELEVKAKPFSKDFSLVENGWMTAGKLAASTVGLGAVGAGAGAGLAFIPHPQKIAVGAAAIGVPVGTFIGLVTGLLTPGLKYHAKQGEEIHIILCDDLWIPKCNIKEW